MPKEPSKQRVRTSQLAEKPTLRGSTVEFRPLTDVELQRLESALGKSVDRQYLQHWISVATRDVARLSFLPTPKELRIELMRLAREGRQWLRHAKEYSDTFSPRQRMELDQLLAAAEAFLEGLDFMAAQAAASIKAGHPRTHFGLLAFLDRMIGIAKRARVRPSTPMRAIPTKRPPPAFFRFVLEALAVASDIIASSPLPDSHKDAALSILRINSKEALIKILEELRGRIGDYQDAPYGLIEWPQK
jgi:hypothetical protein